jgi:anti-sigma B factor antagonist
MSGDTQGVRGGAPDIEVSRDRTVTTLRLMGELDMTGTERFWSFLSEALAAKPRSVTIDAHGLKFIDSAGLMALVRARDAIVEAGVGFHVVLDE